MYIIFEIFIYTVCILSSNMHLYSKYLVEYMLDTMSYLEDINVRKLYLQRVFANVICLGLFY